MRLLLAALLVAAACSQLGQAARLTPENSAELLTDAPSGLSYTLPKNATYKNVKPLIGILTQPCTECPGASECTPAFHQVRVTCRPKRASLPAEGRAGTNYIAAAFAKWVELAGGRPVPIRCAAKAAWHAQLTGGAACTSLTL